MARTLVFLAAMGLLISATAGPCPAAGPDDAGVKYVVFTWKTFVDFTHAAVGDLINGGMVATS